MYPHVCPRVRTAIDTNFEQKVRLLEYSTPVFLASPVGAAAWPPILGMAALEAVTLICCGLGTGHLQSGTALVRAVSPGPYS